MPEGKKKDFDYFLNRIDKDELNASHQEGINDEEGLAKDGTTGGAKEQYKAHLMSVFEPMMRYVEMGILPPLTDEQVEELRQSIKKYFNKHHITEDNLTHMKISFDEIYRRLQGIS